MSIDIASALVHTLKASGLTGETASILSAIATGLAAMFAAASAIFTALSLSEIRRDHLRSMRPILDLTTDAHTIEYRWEVRPTPAGQSAPFPGQTVKYWADRDHTDINGRQEYYLRVWLSNLSAQPATNIRATCELVPAFRRKDLAGLDLANAIGGNSHHRMTWSDGRYNLIADTGGGAGWLDACATALPVVSHLGGGQEREVMIPPGLLHNLLLLLYREARIAGRMKTSSAYVRPKIVVRLSYDTPAAETVFRKYVIDLPVINCGYVLNGVPWDAMHGIRDRWEAFTSSISPGVLRAGSRLPRRLGSRGVRRAFRQTHTSAQSLYGFRSESLAHQIKRMWVRTICRIRVRRGVPPPPHLLDNA